MGVNAFGKRVREILPKWHSLMGVSTVWELVRNTVQYLFGLQLCVVFVLRFCDLYVSTGGGVGHGSDISCLNLALNCVAIAVV